MAKFKKFDPREHIRGLALAAAQIQKEETLRKTRNEVEQMLRPEQMKFNFNVIPGSSVIQ